MNLRTVRAVFLIAASLAALVWLATIAHCDARDVNTINGNRLCPARDCTMADVRHAAHQADYRAQIRAIWHPVNDRMPMFWPAGSKRR